LGHWEDGYRFQIEIKPKVRNTKVFVGWKEKGKFSEIALLILKTSLSTQTKTGSYGSGKKENIE
jgi:hypothetical protein